MKKLDLESKIFGRLKGLKEVPSPRKESRWLCQCECGNYVEIRGSALTSDRTKSCGCLAIEAAKEVAKREGLVKKGHKGYNDKRVNGVATFLINDKMQKNNTTGYKGVQKYFLASGEVRYMAYLTVGKKRYSKSGFITPTEAYDYRQFLIEKHVPKKE